MSSLFAIATETRAAIDAVAATFDPETGEIADPAAFDQATLALDALDASFNEKAAAVVAYCDDQLAFAAQMREREDAIHTRRKAIEARAARLKVYLRDSMALRGVRKIETVDFRISLRKTPPALEVFDESQIPERFWVPQDPKLNRMLLKETIKNGQDVPGAKLGEPGQTIVIK